MKRRFFKRATAILLALVTAMSLVTVSFAGADGHGTGGGNNAGTYAGTFSRSWAGYRIYLFDDTTGQRVSNVVDFVTDYKHWAGVAGKCVIYPQTKLGSFTISYNGSGDIKRGDDFAVYPMSYVPNLETNSQRTSFFEPSMLPDTKNGGVKGNGEAVKNWMLNNKGFIGGYSIGDSSPSTGGGSPYKGGNQGIPTKTTESNSAPTSADAVKQIMNYSYVSEIMAFYQAGNYTKAEARYTWTMTKSAGMSAIVSMYGNGPEIQGAWNEILKKVDAELDKYSSWPTDAQTSSMLSTRAEIAAIRTAEKKMQSTLVKAAAADIQEKFRYGRITSIQRTVLEGLLQKQRTKLGLDASWTVDSLFNTAYAVEAVGEGAGSGNHRNYGNLYTILNASKNDTFFFRYNNDKAAEQASCGRADAVSYIAYEYDYKVAVEPTFWFIPAKVSNGKMGGVYNEWFYGTPTNYSQWQVEQAAKSGGWTDGGYGGWNRRVLNKVGAACLILNDPEDALTFSNGSGIASVSIPSEPLSHNVLSDTKKGYAMHWYSFRKTGGVPTYDPTIGDTPHPAPDPTIPDPTGDNYNVNIVKVYDYQHEDGTVEHVTTTLKTQEPGWIQIQHEPTYKVIAYFTSNSLYNPVVSGTTWEDVNTVPVITGSEFSWSTVKNKPAGTNADTIKISKSAPEGSSESNATNLYVRLLKTDVTTQVDYGANVISESQLNKVIGTDKRFGDDSTQSKTWGDYLFTMKLKGDLGAHWIPVPLLPDIFCGNYQYTGNVYVTYTASQTASDVESQSKSSAASVFKPIIKTLTNDSKTTKAVSGSSAISWDNGPEYNNDDGVAQFTTIWRGCVDTVTLAKYKKSDMTGYGNLTTLFATANSNPAKRATGSMYTRPITLSISASATAASIVCGKCGDSGGTETPSIEPQTNDFTGTVKIFCYAGKAHGLSSTTVGTIENATSGNFKISVFNKKCETTLKFNPYIRMSFQYTQDGYDTTQYNTEGAKLFKPLAQPGNTFNGALGTYLKDRTAYVLSDKQSSILPTNAIEVGWYNPTQTSGKYGLQMTSQQWSIHNRATNGSEWRKPNQVLPGGAMYQLNTTGTETTLRAITYSAMVNPTDTWIDGATANEYSAAQVTKNNNEFIEQYRDIVENYKVVQWVNKDWSLNMPWDNNNAVKIERGGESLSKLGLSTKASTDSKYLLFAGNSGNGASEGDIDILSESYVVTMYKIFTDSEGNVYFAKQQSSPSKTPATEDTFSGLMTQLANTNGTNPTGAILLGTRTQNVDQVMASIQTSNNEVYQVDQKTGAVRNVLNAISRNRGNDENAAWVTDNKWYNEAFDGYYVAMQTMTYKVGFKDPSRRVSVLDPNLCPAKSSTSNIFTNAHVSAFRLNDKSDSAKASGKGSGYMGTFFGIDAFMPDVENMFYTRPFYIPNANVQDLD